MFPPPPTTLRVALDWTPNTLHSGLFLAQAHGFYSSRGLDVELISPSSTSPATAPTYPTTPAKLLEAGDVDLCICPSESCIAYAEKRLESSSSSSSSSSKPTPLHLQAIYAILPGDASAIATVLSATRMRDLADKGLVYGSYDARYEDDIVRAMVKADADRNGDRGGGGDVDVTGMRIKGGKELGKLDLWGALREKSAKGEGGVDATWIFLPWEGVEAELELELDGGDKAFNYFSPTEHGVPYGYSPVIARNASPSTSTSTSTSTKLTPSVLRAFIAATQQGYALALSQPEEAVKCLEGKCVPRRSEKFLTRSMERVNEFLLTDAGAAATGTATRAKAEEMVLTLGRMEPERWERWVAWLKERGLVRAEVVVQGKGEGGGDGEDAGKGLFTNAFFPS